jgi:hypothetical protein
MIVIIQVNMKSVLQRIFLEFCVLEVEFSTNNIFPFVCALDTPVKWTLWSD